MSNGTPAYLHRVASRYLDGVAAELAATKRALHDLMRPAPGQRLLDVGCGTGVDVLALAERVGPGGQVVGVDSSSELIEEARRRAPAELPVSFETGDACALPFSDDGFHATRAERVLQHVPDAQKAVSEMLRVTAPGGRVVVADPDHDMWAPDVTDKKLTRELLAWWVDHIRNPWMGRQLPGLFTAAGLTDVKVEILPVILTSLAAADAIIGLVKVPGSAIEQGIAPPDQVRSWQEDMLRRDAEGRFLLCGAIVVTHGRKPPAHA